jgi:alkylation response protein AidB-like acyl-CoA dehydrogenase
MTATVESVRLLAPLIGGQADAIESTRCLPGSVVAALRDAGVFRAFIPRVLGGAESDPVTFCRVVEELARIDGSTGWCSMLCGSYGLFGGLLPTTAAREIFADQDVIMAGSLAPSGTACAVDDGYKLTGRWSFGSGITHSTWVLGGCRVLDGDVARLTPRGTPELRLLFFPRSDVEIIDTWHVGGLRGTGSHDYQVQDLFVPAHRSCWFTEQPVEPGPLYTLPLITMSTALMAGVVLGIARHALDTLEGLAAVKTPARAQTVLREDPVARVRIGEAEGLLRAGQAFVYRTLDEVWDVVRREGHLGQEQHGLLRLAGTQAVTQALQAADLAFRAGGASSIFLASPLERCLRDIRAATQHHILTPSNYELAGQLFLGFDIAATFWGRDYR